MLRIGIVGTGTMGSIIGTAIDRREVEATLVGLADLNHSKAERFASGLNNPPPILEVPGLVEVADLVVEAAGASALKEILPEVISHSKDVLVLSVGGLIENEEWILAAQAADSTIHCPSGAIAGLDAVKAARMGRIAEARIRSRKPPAGLKGAPYLVERSVNLDGFKGPRIVFEGTAREACRAFPANINVSAALSLAGIGVDRTRVEIVADPTIERNIHEIEVSGDFGLIRTVTENTPSDNPKTSRLAALSALALIRNLTSRFRIGT